MDAGDTFINEKAPGLTQHLWIIISDPGQDADNVLIVNVTTTRVGSDLTCELNVGDHPFITHPSCINYQDAKITSIELLEQLDSHSLLFHKDPCSADLLERVRAGAGEPDSQLRNAARLLLRNQGLIE